jgi:hypothetical protein
MQKRKKFLMLWTGWGHALACPENGNRWSGIMFVKAMSFGETEKN